MSWAGLCAAHKSTLNRAERLGRFLSWRNCKPCKPRVDV
ncbi:hypothetical protein TGAM01_v205588 [Trichoderma gamsii]|uniref:Uncharacterized protein n=1 Tax=Trichoderma gamsii TaxID=398673 RepID=A0A2P4ZN47_9HYPO|nr:hypothetical protein TGAM01_v205588 [Trichoderma gamsii]PON25703.1 hypothetical protein TGAM01_v205588 [Trichoderma gamsii]